MNVVVVTSEYAPYAKSGGLADAVAAISRSMARRGHRVRAILPRYYSIDRGQLTPDPVPLPVPGPGGTEPARIYRSVDSGVEMLFVDFEPLFGRDGIYGSRPDDAFADNLARFAFFARAALATVDRLSAQGEPDILHVHDWPAALVPVLLRANGAARTARVVLTIHNAGYQGAFPIGELGATGIDGKRAGRLGLVYNDTVNLLRAGVTCADAVTTVSPTHAEELLREETSFGLHSVLSERTRPLQGILNGIDTTEWDPAGDPYIAMNFDARDRSGKAACKRALQREFGLPDDPAVPVIGQVTRLVEQKGIGPLFGPGYGSAFRICSDLPVQWIILGSGAAWCEDEIAALARRLANLRGRIGYDEALAHRIEAGADIFLMPSLYEPCGLNQMYSMRYGTVPIAPRTGGLADTVREDRGFIIDRVTPESIFDAVARATRTYRNAPELFAALSARGMEADFSWDRSAADYEALFHALAGR